MLNLKSTENVSADTLLIKVSGDSYEGPPLMRVHVNGQQLGDTYEVTAQRGEWQDIVISTGLGDIRPYQIEIEFLNDRNDGSADKDRNLIVDHIEVGGLIYEPENAVYERAYGLSSVNGSKIMNWGGKLQFDTTAPGKISALTMTEDAAIDFQVDNLVQALQIDSVDNVVIRNVPEGAVLTEGEEVEEGVWEVSEEDLEELQVIPPENSDNSFELVLDFGIDEVPPVIVPIFVDAVADDPNITVGQAQGNEDGAIALNIDALTSDNDGSESITNIIISHVPEGATLSAGSYLGDGRWQLTTADLEGLSINTPVDSDADFTLQVSVTTTEANGGDSNTRTVAMPVEVNAVADGATISTTGHQGESDISVRVSGHHFEGEPKFVIVVDGEVVGGVHTVTADHNNDEWQTFSVSGDFGVNGPEDVSIRFLNDRYGGSKDKDRNLVVDYLEVNGNRMEPADAEEYSRAYGMSTIDGREVMGWTGDMKFDTGPKPVETLEDTPVALNFAVGLRDTDGSESISSVTVSGVPDGALLSAGINNGDGTWTLTAAQVEGLEITPAPGSAADFTLTISATSTESENGDSAVNHAEIPVVVHGVADAPHLQTAAVTGDEDTPIALNIDASVTGSGETLSVDIAGVPEGAVLSAGIDSGDGSWTLTEAELEGLTITPPANSDDDFSLAVTATSLADDSGDLTTVTSVIPVTVDAVADGAVLTNPEDLSSITFRVSGDGFNGFVPDYSAAPEFNIYVDGVQVGGTWHATADIQEGKWQEFTITGDWGSTGPGVVEVEFTNDLWCKPQCADRDLLVDNINVNGEVYGAQEAAYLRYAIAADYSGEHCDPDTVAANIAAGRYEEATGAQDQTVLSGRQRLSWEGRLIFDVRDNGGPTGIEGNEDSAIPLYFNPNMIDTDGSEQLSIVIAGVPLGALLSAGEDNGDGTWTLSEEQLNNLTITPPRDSDEDFVLSVTLATTEEANGDTAISEPLEIPVKVHAVADQPTVRTESATGLEDTWIALEMGGGTTDIDGSESLSYLISDVPDGATLSAGTRNEDGTWSLTEAQTEGLSILPPPDVNGELV
ncbi:MAG: carbohydrate-binding domain-containing protein, partial [Pseudomonadota bacterium]